MYKIAYIDESKRDRDNFQRYLRASNFNDFELHVLEPQPDLSNFVSDILSSHYMAIIVDFHLSEKKPSIHYDGWDLAKEILAFREGLPMFILTAYDIDAIMGSDDVRLVYDKKSAIHSDSYIFLDRVKRQIQVFKKQVDDAERRLLELITLSNVQGLNVVEEEELIKLDNFIEKSLSKKNPMPNKFKSLSNETRLDKIIDLLDRIDKTIQKVNNK